MESLYRENYVDLVNYIRRHIGDAQLAEDLATECFVLVCRRSNLSDVSRPWLFRAAQNVMTDARRKRKRDDRLLVEIAAQERLSSPPDSASARAAEVFDALARLSEGDRHLLELIHWDGLSAAEIAIVLDVPAHVVWKRSSRAHRRLRKFVDEQSINAQREEERLHAMD